MLPRPDSVLPDTSCNNTNYPTDLTDAQWALIGPLLPPPDTSGAPRTTTPGTSSTRCSTGSKPAASGK